MTINMYERNTRYVQCWANQRPTGEGCEYLQKHQLETVKVNTAAWFSERYEARHEVPICAQVYKRSDRHETVQTAVLQYVVGRLFIAIWLVEKINI